MVINNIKNYIKDLSITDLAKNTKISRTLISQLVNSKDIPDKTRFDVLTKISNELNVPIDWLYSEIDRWLVDKVSKIDNGLTGSNFKEVFILKLISDTYGIQNPLYMSIDISDQYKTIVAEFIQTSDISMIYYLNESLANELFKKSLNENHEFMESINTKFTKSLMDDVLISTTFNDIFNKYLVDPINSVGNKRYNLRLHFQPLDFPIIKIDKKIALSAYNSDTLLNNFSNTNVFSIFNSWIDANPKDPRYKKALLLRNSYVHSFIN